MKLNRLLAITLALAAFPFSVHASHVQSLSSLDQLKAGVSAASETAPLPQVSPDRPGSEVAGMYNDFSLNADARFEAAASASLKNCKVLLIPGFLSDVNPNQFHLPFPPRPPKAISGTR